MYLIVNRLYLSTQKLKFNICFKNNLSAFALDLFDIQRKRKQSKKAEKNDDTKLRIMLDKRNESRKTISKAALMISRFLYDMSSSL